MTGWDAVKISITDAEGRFFSYYSGGGFEAYLKRHDPFQDVKRRELNIFANVYMSTARKLPGSEEAFKAFKQAMSDWNRAG